MRQSEEDRLGPQAAVGTLVWRSVHRGTAGRRGQSLGVRARAQSSRAAGQREQEQSGDEGGPCGDQAPTQLW